MNEKLEDWKIGVDAEIFVVTPDGAVFNAEHLISGTKYEPTVIEGSRTISADNILAEYTINPVETKDEFVKEISTMRSYVDSFIQEKGYRLDFSPARLDTKQALDTENSLILGCDPDFNVYKRMMNEVTSGDATELRSSGAHIHCSWPTCNSTSNVEQIEKFIMACDLFLAIPFLFIEPNSERRKLYGKAGSFRFKQYTPELSGVEYRSLSGWAMSTDENLNFIWENLMKAIDFVNSDDEIQDPSEIEEAINTNNLELASKLMRQYEITGIKQTS